MGSLLGQRTTDKLVIYAQKHYSMDAMGFSSHLQLRVMIAEQMYHLYSTSKVPLTTSPQKVAGEVAQRVYRQILTNAPTNEKMDLIRRECEITETSRRTYAELANDIAAFDIFMSFWGADTRNLDKAICKDAARWLVETGKKQNDSRAVAAGITHIEKFNNDFKDDDRDNANTAATEVDFIADVDLVRPGETNFSREAIEEFKKKYGAFVDKKGGIETLIETSEGVYESLPDDEEEDDDYFVKKEKELQDLGDF